MRRPFLLPLLALLLLLGGCREDQSPPRHAHQGVLDLGGYDLETQGPVNLDGEWDFYWQQLLTPTDFSGTHPPLPPAFLDLPRAWNGFLLRGETLGGPGFATFRLRVLPGPGETALALRLVDLHSAYRLWGNGQLLVAGGVVGRSAAEEVTDQAIRLPQLSGIGQPIELVLQVSNYHYREGGVVAAIELGPARQLVAKQERQWGVALFCIGSLLVMGIYHIVLFCLRRTNMAPLYFGIYCLLWLGYSLTSNSSGWVARLFVDTLPPWLEHRLDMLCFVISVPVGYSFFRTLYPREFSRRLQQLTWLMALLFTTLGVALSSLAFTTVIPAYYLYAMLMILLSLAMLLRAVRHRREGAGFILLGFLILGVTGINDMLYDLQLLRSTYLIHIGMFVFILCQALALAARFSRAFAAVEQLSGELSEKNLALEEEIVARARLEQEIVTVSEDERRRISHDLHDGLCQQLTGARLHFSVLERKLAAGGQSLPELRQVSTLLAESVNHAYDLSRGLWPVEHDQRGGCPSLEELTRRLGESGGIAVEYSRQIGCGRCGSRVMIQLYRIAQEAITNAVKHARASRIVVALDCHDRKGMVLRVRDNGVGRATAVAGKGGLGLGIMAYRARVIGGTLTVADVAEGGTEVICRVPCGEDLTEGQG